MVGGGSVIFSFLAEEIAQKCKKRNQCIMTKVKNKVQVVKEPLSGRAFFCFPHFTRRKWEEGAKWFTLHQMPCSASWWRAYIITLSPGTFQAQPLEVHQHPPVSASSSFNYQGSLQTYGSIRSSHLTNTLLWWTGGEQRSKDTSESRSACLFLKAIPKGASSYVR